MPLLPILRKSPFARLLFFYAGGIALSDLVCGKSILILSILILLLFVTLVVFESCHRSFFSAWISGLIASLIIFLCGIWAFGIQSLESERSGLIPEGPSVYRVRIIDIPVDRGRNIKTVARLLAGSSGLQHMHRNPRILLYFRKDISPGSIYPGMELMIRASLQNIPGPGNPGEFDYRKYLAIRHIYRQAFVDPDDWTNCDPAGIRSPRILACIMRLRLLEQFEKIGMDTTSYGLAVALTLGYKEDLDAHTKQVFTRAGVMHIMALSGFNVGIIALVLGFLLGIFNANLPGRIAKTLLIILFIWLFAFVTGLSASVTRAAAMISLVMTGKLFRRQVNTYNILFASAFLLLAWSPGMLADVSFQLSFAAVAGIILYQPLLYGVIRFRNKLLSRIWQLFTVSCAAQLATFPISIYYFHQFPVYFWVTNLYVGPLVSGIICLAGLYLAVAWINPLAAILGKGLMLSLKGLYESVSIVETFPCSLIDGIKFNMLHTALLIGMVLTMALFMLFRKAGWLCCCLFLMCLFLSVNAANSIKRKRQQVFLVASIRGETAINLIQGRSAVLFADQSLQQGDTRLTYALGNFWINHGVKPAILDLDSLSHISGPDTGMQDLFWKTGWRGENVLVSFAEKRIVILRDDRFFNYGSVYPLNVDMVIITGRVRADICMLNKQIRPGMIILDSSVGWTLAGKWIRQIEETRLKYHAVTQHGAYVSYPGQGTPKSRPSPCPALQPKEFHLYSQ